MNLEPVPLFLLLLSGICWTTVYLDGIRIGFKQRTYAIPFWALALNIAWEILNTVLGFRELGPQIQTWINAVWTLFDFGILYTYFRYGRKWFPSNVQQRWFIPWSLLALVTAFVIQYFFIAEFGLLRGRAYAAFSQNLLMSVLFIAMLVQRGSTEGQSLTIAVNKWIGTLAPTVLIGIIGAEGFDGPNPLVLALGLSCCVFDLIYIAMLAQTRRRERRGEPGGPVF